MSIDFEKIKSRLLEIQATVEKIEHYAQLPDKEFWSDERNIYTLKHLLLQCIEAAASVCAHLAAKKLYKPVASFGECFRLLGERGIVSDDLAAKLQQMAKFRNLLVHQYWQVNDEQVLAYARHNIKDLNQFVAATKQYLK